jgi:membrane-bound serine protease (ClpP class)
MKTTTRLMLIIVFLGLLVLVAPVNAQTGSTAIVLQAEGALTTAMSSYIARGLNLANQRGAQLVILQLNTPGGSVDLMTQIVEDIRNSDIPVVVYVSPRGAIAGSAGTVITLAGHAAAMAPDTAIGAASPVSGEGEDIGETLEAKIKEIIKAQIRTLAEGRPPEAIAAAQDTVENATALTATEAYDIGLVDFIASDIPDLLQQLDGHSVTTANGEHTLSTQYLELDTISPSILEELLNILTNPNIVFLLLSIGVQAVLIEIGSPGGWFAGFLGVVCLALAAYGLGILPVNYFGLIFLATAFVLFFLEIKATTHGALAAAGIISFIVGGLVLFNSSNTPPDFRVSIPLVVVTSLITASSFILILTFAIRAQKTPQHMGQAALIGRVGIVRETIQPHTQGKVHLSGELWSAELATGDQPLEPGQRVEVVEIEGLRLKVKPKEEE